MGGLDYVGATITVVTCTTGGASAAKKLAPNQPSHVVESGQLHAGGGGLGFCRTASSALASKVRMYIPSPSLAFLLCQRRFEAQTEGGEGGQVGGMVEVDGRAGGQGSLPLCHKASPLAHRPDSMILCL